MKKKILCAMMAATMCLSALAPMYADEVYKDSIASVDMQDDGVTVGFDETQNKKTEYSAEITENVEGEACEVYATQASSFSVVIPKTVILNGKKGEENSGAYVVNVKGDIAGVQNVSVVPDETVTLSQAGKPDITANIDQPVNKFMVSTATSTDADVVKGVELTDGVSTNGKITVEGLSAGSWAGQFTFDIALNTPTAVEGE